MQWDGRRGVRVIVAAAAIGGGCFVDEGGSASAAETTGPSGGSSTTHDQGTSAGSSSSTGPMTTTATTTTTTSTTTSQGTEPTTTTTSTSTTDGCGECVPGTVERGEPCGECGSLERTCLPECTWSDWTCVGADSCDVWRLPDGAIEWTRHRAADLGGGTNAPQGPRQGAFSAIALGEAWVLTESSIHILDVQTMTWTEVLDRDLVFPDVAGEAILYAYSVNHGEIMNVEPTTAEDVYLITADTIYIYSIDLLSGVAFGLEQTDCCNQPINANEPLLTDVLAYWADLPNLNEWASVPLDVCDMPETNLGRYGAAIVNDETIRLQDLGYCFEYATTFDYSKYAPFTYSRAPPTASSIGAITYVQGLVAFAPN